MPLSSSTRRPDSSHLYENAPVRVPALRRSEQKQSTCDRIYEQPTRCRFLHSTATCCSGCHVPYSPNSRRQRYSRVNHPSQLTHNVNKYWPTDQVQDKSEQLQILAGFSSITLRELITDYVLELLKSHPQTAKHTILSTIEGHKAHTSNGHYELTSSFGDRNNCVLSGNQPGNGGNTRRLESKSTHSLPKAGRIPRVHLEPHNSLPVRNITKANEVYPMVSTSPLRPKEPKQVSGKSCSTDRVQDNADDLVNLTNSRNQQSSHTVHSRSQIKNATENECSFFTARRETKSQKPLEAHQDIPANNQNPSIQKYPAHLSVRSSLRGTRTYSTDCTLKKLRFERRKDFHSPV